MNGDETPRRVTEWGDLADLDEIAASLPPLQEVADLVDLDALLASLPPLPAGDVVGMVASVLERDPQT